MADNLPTRRQTQTGAMPEAFQRAQLDPAFAQSQVDPTDITQGIGMSFPVMSIRGRVFRIKFRGEEYPVVIPGTQHPAPNIDVVMIKASPAISKVFYESQFVEGNRDAPDCFSTNGVQPDAAAVKKQSVHCATCPQNLWGSKMVNDKAMKACQDTKRVAVVPLGDLRNEAFGGPMLLRVPPASLQDLSQYADTMVQWGQTYFSVGTQITFDIDVAHPKLKFAPMMPLTGDQARLIVELQEHPQVRRMLTEAVEYARAESPDQPAQPPGGQPINAPQQAQQAAPPPPVQPQQAYTPPQMPELPAHLDRRTQVSTAPAAGGMTVATVAAPPPTNGQVLTAEQQRIRELEAELAAAKASPAAPQPVRARGSRRGTPPPSPAPTAAPAPEGAAVAPPVMTTGTPAAPPAQPMTVAQPGSAVQAPPQSQALSPGDTQARLDSLLTTILPKSGT